MGKMVSTMADLIDMLEGKASNGTPQATFLKLVRRLSPLDCQALREVLQYHGTPPGERVKHCTDGSPYELTPSAATIRRARVAVGNMLKWAGPALRRGLGVDEADPMVAALLRLAREETDNADTQQGVETGQAAD